MARQPFHLHYWRAQFLIKNPCATIKAIEVRRAHLLNLRIAWFVGIGMKFNAAFAIIQQRINSDAWTIIPSRSERCECQKHFNFISIGVLCGAAFYCIKEMNINNTGRRAVPSENAIWPQPSHKHDAALTIRMEASVNVDSIEQKGAKKDTRIKLKLMVNAHYIPLMTKLNNSQTVTNGTKIAH